MIFNICNSNGFLNRHKFSLFCSVFWFSRFNISMASEIASDLCLYSMNSALLFSFYLDWILRVIINCLKYI